MFLSDPSLDVVAPGLIAQDWNEAQILGSAVWLWMHSASHRDMPIHTLSTLLLPAIKARQFLLASEAGNPVAYVAWAWLSGEAESRYLAQSPLLMPSADWTSGERLWILDWVCPFGHSKRVNQLFRGQLFASRCVRSLYHRGNERGLRVKEFHGRALELREAKAWFDTHPVSYPLPKQ